MKIDMDKVSFILGQSFGMDFSRQGFAINVDIFVNAFTEAFAGKPSRMPAGEMQQIMAAFKNEIQEKNQARQADAVNVNMERGQAFLSANRKKEGVVETASGLQYRVLKKGNGNSPASDDNVTVHYEGKTIDGKVFDSSIKRGSPADFAVNGVIRGWQEALQIMPERSRYELVIPSELAYGAGGAGAAIGPHEVLVFEVELISIQHSKGDRVK